MRHVYIIPMAAALVLAPLAIKADRAGAFPAAPGLERLAPAPIEKAGCWRWGWHGWGWYPWCGWGGPGYGWGGWGWHRGWGWRHGWHRGWGWHHGWHRGGGWHHGWRHR